MQHNRQHKNMLATETPRVVVLNPQQYRDLMSGSVSAEVAAVRNIAAPRVMPTGLLGYYMRHEERARMRC